jgi:aryl-alcohol dehydrogenase-like predicted oxidoreductase
MTPSQGGVPELPLRLERHAALLTGQIQSPDDFEEDDFRRTSPRFQGENFRKNLELVERVKEIAAEKGVMPGQLALAWLLHQGEDIVSIPVPNAASTWRRTPLL